LVTSAFEATSGSSKIAVDLRRSIRAAVMASGLLQCRWMVPQRARTILAVALAVSASFAFSSAAHAEPNAKDDIGFFSVEAVATQWSKFPSLTLAGASAPRLLVGLKSPDAGPVTTYGIGADFGVRMGWLNMGLAHLRYARGGGETDGSEVANELPVAVSMRPLNTLEIGAMAIVPTRLGLQYVGSTFKVGAAFEWGATYAWASANMIDPIGGASSGGMDGWSLYARGELSACAVLHKKPDDIAEEGVAGDVWGCLVAMPSLYDFGWLQGQSIGIKVDF
jgi:hypothetical protein